MPVDCIHPKPGLQFATLTDVGRQRLNNEDSFLYWEPESDDDFAAKGRLAVIADGMGGHQGGQEASRLAVETVRFIYDRDSHSDPQRALVTGLRHAHETIQRYAADHPEFAGMGTTCTALSIVGRQLHFAHIGDSRLYLIRSGESTRLTRDHSYVGRLVECGLVRSEDAESHPQRHILTAALGSGREVIPHTPEQPIPLEDGDVLILCTDGLWSVVGESELARIALEEIPAEACLKFIEAALERGGPDNVTVLVLRITQIV
ncbi:MAG TPA: PP2C family serine/threonine-protein phosphatase [Dongiaceae bacterium]|nr:PP2C family serine/threonine-protein phosphatase [Dongiaceae bacterium]